MAEKLCDFCKKYFKDIYLLERHQRTAKFCLKIQAELNESKPTCNICKKTYYSDRELKAHKCSFYQEDLFKVIYEMQQEIKTLKQRLDVKDQKYDLKPLTQEDFLNCSKHLSLSVIKLGASGFANFAYKFVFKEKLQCVNFSRKKFIYKDENGKTKVDIDLQCLRTEFFSALLDRTRELVMEAKEPIYTDTPESIEELIYDKWFTLQEIKESVKVASEGAQTPFVNAFVKLLAGKLGEQE